MIRAAIFVFALLAAAQTPGRRPLKIEDVHSILAVADVQISPDGEWVAYSLSSVDKAEDKSDTDLWMVRWDGSGRAQLTSSKESETNPRWSPDGKWLAFLSARADKEAGAQVWLLPRSGGEAAQLTTLKESVTDLVWSPDSKRLALVAASREEKKKPPPPIVIDRYHFKQDMQGYLTRKPSRIHLFEIGSKKDELLSSEELEETAPAWSPDGTKIAFLSNRAGEKAMYTRWQLCVAEARPGSAVQELTTEDRISGGRGGRPAWSKDGARIFFLLGREPKFRAYNRMALAAVPVSGGTPEMLLSSAERSIGGLQTLSTGGPAFLVSDDMSESLARLPGRTTLGAGKFVITSWSEARGHVAVLASNDDAPAEVHALENGKLRALSDHNDAWLKKIELGPTREVRFKNPSGVEVHGLLTLPPGYQEGKKLPLLLRIHGGPNGQDSHSFQFERHLFAANGYAVLQVNYRGSSGRDEAFQTAIFADWGNKEVEDLMAGVDHVIQLGIADENRLGIGGWSYGGILTDYMIARTARFKAATSGAGSALQLSMYGSDQYIEQYDREIGFPWKAEDSWRKISYPFLEAAKIRTPTLFLGGEKDFNVPIIGSEQMYQALRANGVEAQLIIYPGENHGIRRPSYVQDRLERYLAWYKKYLPN
jgi:dipeptidyl aminopeptidase/acylaminoacyl peptidase